MFGFSPSSPSPSPARGFASAEHRYRRKVGCRHGEAATGRRSGLLPRRQACCGFILFFFSSLVTRESLPTFSLDDDVGEFVLLSSKDKTKNAPPNCRVREPGRVSVWVSSCVSELLLDDFLLSALSGVSSRRERAEKRGERGGETKHSFGIFRLTLLFSTSTSLFDLLLLIQPSPYQLATTTPTTKTITTTPTIHSLSYDEGLIGGAALAFARDLGLSDSAVGAAVGAAKAGAVAGAAAGGACMQSHGRVPALRWVAAAFVVGPLIMALARGLGALVVGRLVVGLGIGGAAVVVPAYLGEVAPARSRGRVVESFEVALAAGMLVAVMVDAALSGGGGSGGGGSAGTGATEQAKPHWRVMVGLPVLPAFLLAAGSLFLPESPRWLVVRGRLDEALAVIHRVITNERVAPVPASSSSSSSSAPLFLLLLLLLLLLPP